MKSRFGFKERKERIMRSSLLVLFAVSLLIIAPGCRLTEDTSSSPGSVPPPDEGMIDLDSPTGGLTTSNEAPAFGESSKYEMLADERPIDDPIESSFEYRNALRAGGARVFDFRALWGHLARIVDSTATGPCPLDWSGSLRLEGGIIAIEKAIAFEPDDSLMRVDRSTIRWISHTGPHVDGIQVKLVVPPPLPADSTGVDRPDPRLILTTPLYRRTFTLDELIALNLVVPVDRCGNGISMTSILVPLRCPHGHLAGAWETAAPDTTESGDIILGVFRGIWIGNRGIIAGHLRGFYGLNSAGKKVFFGKYIDLDGTFQGILRGTFGRNPECATDDIRPRGWFIGEWMAENTAIQGRLKGHWIADREAGAGLFHGNWGMRCSTNL